LISLHYLIDREDRFSQWISKSFPLTHLSLGLDHFHNGFQKFLKDGEKMNKVGLNIGDQETGKMRDNHFQLLEQILRSTFLVKTTNY
jgi:hypothetical protein